MARRTVRIEGADASDLRSRLTALEDELGLPGDFPPEVLKAAELSAAAPALPGRDRTDIQFLTIDPEGSMDLDQALHIERRGRGYRVHYAIADVAAFVPADGPVDLEAHRRGETFYGADHRIPLHPTVLSEGAASLLPEQVRPAVLWTIHLDSTGECVEVDVHRARVLSRAKLSYTAAQREIERGNARPTLGLLADVGRLRRGCDQVRGGVSLALPEQEVVITPHRWSLQYRAQLPVEEWNAQISLLTGMAAARLMMYGQVGLLRTMPPAGSREVARLHRTAAALQIRWPAEVSYPEFIRGLDPTVPTHAAMLDACTGLLRGAGYVAFEGRVPEQPEHSALAAEYAHVTAPLRRLADRYAGEICLALCSGDPVPDWALSKLRDLPKEMEAADRRGHQYDAAVLDLVEAGVLAPHVGRRFTGVVTDLVGNDPKRGWVALRDPAVSARVDGERDLPLGHEVTVTLVEADLATRTVRFALA